MYLKNPTDSVVKVMIQGVRLSIEPRGHSAELSEEQINRWLVIHPFLERVKVSAQEDGVINTYKDVSVEETASMVKETLDVPSEEEVLPAKPKRGRKSK